MTQLTQFFPSIIAVSVVGLISVSLLSLATSPVEPNSLAIDKSKIKDAITDLKISTMKINQLMDRIDSRVEQTSNKLDQQINTLESNQLLHTKADSLGMESDFSVWSADYLGLIEQEGYYLERSNKRVAQLAKNHDQSMLYIDDLIRQNNELFNLFTPPKSNLLIQQNDILNFKLSLQKQK